MKKISTIIAILLVAVFVFILYRHKAPQQIDKNVVDVRSEITKLQDPGTNFVIGREIILSHIGKTYTEVTFPEMNGQDIQPWTLYVTEGLGLTKKVESFERTASIIATSADEKYLFVSTYGDRYCQGMPTIAVVRASDDTVVFENNLITQANTQSNISAKVESIGWPSSDTVTMKVNTVSCDNDPVEKPYIVKLDLTNKTQSVVEGI